MNRLICHSRIDLGGRLGLSRQIDVIDESEQPVSGFDFMCSAIDSDIQSVDYTGVATLDAIRRVETGQSCLEELGGNAWYTYIAPEGVHFEGQYSQGVGGLVSLSQYKTAVTTFLSFLADRDRKRIEIPLPDR